MPTAAEIAAHPYPTILQHPSSGLSFRWAEAHHDGVKGSSSHTFGPDGVTAVMKMYIYWDDLEVALQELLGYSWREPPVTLGGSPILRRSLPWQHPVFNQLYVKRISECVGIRHQGRLVRTGFGPPRRYDGPGRGAGEKVNYGPWTDFFLAELTIHFWRPPYYVRSDFAIGYTAGGKRREWLRYVDKKWDMSLNMLSRENSTYQWLPGIKPPGSGAVFTGSVGQAVTHYKVSRTWYQIPEQALFSSIGLEGQPEGLPRNLTYTQTACENPLSRFDKALGSTTTTFATNTTTVTTTTSGTNTSASTVTTTTTTRSTTTIATTTPSTSAIRGAAGYIYPASSPIGGCVNAPIDGGAAADGRGEWIDLTTASRFFGCYTGTLRFDGVTFDPQPLQLPAWLMDIPRLVAALPEPLSQVQYNVTFHFDLFDPPPGNYYGTPVKGHNLFPFAGNGLWYPILSQKDINNGTTGPKLTPFQYADFADLFQIL